MGLRWGGLGGGRLLDGHPRVHMDEKKVTDKYL